MSLTVEVIKADGWHALSGNRRHTTVADALGGRYASGSAATTPRLGPDRPHAPGSRTRLRTCIGTEPWRALEAALPYPLIGRSCNLAPSRLRAKDGAGDIIRGPHYFQ